MIFTPSMMKRMEYSYEDVYGLHSTSYDSIKMIVSKQRRKTTQISVSSGHDAKGNIDSIKYGVATTGGFMFLLKGDVNGAFSFDAYTARLKGGRRSVLISPNSSFGQSLIHTPSLKLKVSTRNLLNDLMTEMQGLYKPMFQNHIEKPIKDFANAFMNDEYLKLNLFDYDGYFMEKVNMALKSSTDYTKFDYDGNIRFLLEVIESSEDIKQRLPKEITNLKKGFGGAVKFYMDGVESILNKNKEYKKLFVTGVEVDKTLGRLDEMIMSNFRIEVLYVLLDIKFVMDLIQKNYPDHEVKPKNGYFDSETKKLVINILSKETGINKNDIVLIDYENVSIAAQMQSLSDYLKNSPDSAGNKIGRLKD